MIESDCLRQRSCWRFHKPRLWCSIKRLDIPSERTLDVYLLWTEECHWEKELKQDHSIEVAEAWHLDCFGEGVSWSLEHRFEYAICRCFTDGQYHQAIGIALESHRIDMIERAISQTDNRLDMLSYTMSASLKLVTSREFRQKVLRSLVNMYKDSGAKSDYVSVCTCLMFLDDANSVATILDDLILGTEVSRGVVFFNIWQFSLYTWSSGELQCMKYGMSSSSVQQSDIGHH